MSEVDKPSLSDDVSVFQAELGRYEKLAAVVEGVLREAICAEYPSAVVQRRVKSLSGFAEKVARRGYTDPMSEMKDLCGVRVVLQTETAVDTVQRFIEDNFDVHEQQNKRDELGVDAFGYRGRHLVVSVPSAGPLWRGVADAAAVAGCQFEVQVRTWMQHAWAEIVHDRVYKAQLDPNAEEERRSAALAAMLEEGDRIADGFARSIDDRTASYTQFATPEKVQSEIDVRRGLFSSGRAEPTAREAVALARMQRAVGDVDSAITTLRSFGDDSPSVRSELGHCLCLRAWDDPERAEFDAGVELLRDSRNTSGLAARDRAGEARRLTRLGWALSRTPGGLGEACELLQRALDEDPKNPYILCDALTLECAARRRRDVDAIARREVRRAVGTCREHAAAGLELSRADFTAARLSLLVGDRLASLSHYSRALTRLADPAVCWEPRVPDWERGWPDLVQDWDELGPDLEWVRLLLAPVVPAERFAAVLVEGNTPQGLDDASGLRQIPALSHTHGPPDPATILAAVRSFREAVGGGQQVRLLGTAGGDPIYSRVALGLGATVALTGPARESSVLADPVWSGAAMLMPFPDDPSTARELAVEAQAVAPVVVTGDSTSGVPETPDLDAMAAEIHARYLADQEERYSKKAPFCPWDLLPDTYMAANRGQAAGVLRILLAAGFDVVPAGNGDAVTKFSDDEVDWMAKLEHGRWNAERLRDGWRYGSPRDDERKLHDNLVSWLDLDNGTKHHVRQAVKVFPEVLKQVGLVIVRAS